MKQIAALPYRIEDDGEARVMLITSRDTGRWVVPKGNPIKGLSAHEAAAQEAWEEAGLTGITCPTPLGHFRYIKRRSLRGDREAVVATFPLAVTHQSAQFPEAEERETRWFTLASAAEAVDEPELKALIAGFQAPSMTDGMTPAMRARMRGTFSMLGWFQSLMPKQGKFFDQFEAHAAVLVAGADSLARMFSEDGRVASHAADIFAREHDADDITRNVLQDVRRVFVTPFDRSAITELIGVMDDAIDEMNATATSIIRYELTTFRAPMRDITGIVVEAARLSAEAMPLLRSVSDNAGRLNDLTDRLIQVEGHADDIHDAGLKALFNDCRDDPMGFIVGREIYNHLERIVDRFEDVANEIQGLVIDHA